MSFADSASPSIDAQLPFVERPDTPRNCRVKKDGTKVCKCSHGNDGPGQFACLQWLKDPSICGTGEDGGVDGTCKWGTNKVTCTC